MLFLPFFLFVSAASVHVAGESPRQLCLRLADENGLTSAFQHASGETVIELSNDIFLSRPFKVLRNASSPSASLVLNSTAPGNKLSYVYRFTLLLDMFSSVRLTGVTFQGISVYVNSSVEVADCVFDGSSLNATRSTNVSLISSTFSSHGGSYGASLSQVALARIEECTFNNGGVDLSFVADGLVKSSQFTSITYARAIYVRDSSKVVVAEGAVSSCVPSDGLDGCIAVSSGSNLQVTGLSAASITNTGFGAAIAAFGQDVVLNVSGSSFFNCIGSNGGAIGGRELLNSSITVTSSAFSYFTASQDGGALAFDRIWGNTLIVVDDCTFYVTISPYPARGGAISLTILRDAASVSIYRCSFRVHDAVEKSGTIHIEDTADFATVVVSDCTISESGVAYPPDQAGAVGLFSLAGDSSVSLLNTDFSSVTCYDKGGAVAATTVAGNAVVLMKNLRFSMVGVDTGGYSANEGGVFYIYMWMDNARLEMEGITVASASALSYGGVAVIDEIAGHVTMTVASLHASQIGSTVLGTDSFSPTGGGGVFSLYSWGGSAALSISNISATEVYAGTGGGLLAAVYFEGSASISVTSVNFYAAEFSPQFGPLMLHGFSGFSSARISKVSVSSTVFTRGGGVYSASFSDDASVTVENFDCPFSSAYYGGVLSALGFSGRSQFVLKTISTPQERFNGIDGAYGIFSEFSDQATVRFQSVRLRQESNPAFRRDGGILVSQFTDDSLFEWKDGLALRTALLAEAFFGSARFSMDGVEFRNPYSITRTRCGIFANSFYGQASFMVKNSLFADAANRDFGALALANFEDHSGATLMNVTVRCDLPNLLKQSALAVTGGAVGLFTWSNSSSFFAQNLTVSKMEAKTGGGAFSAENCTNNVRIAIDGFHFAAETDIQLVPEEGLVYLLGFTGTSSFTLQNGIVEACNARLRGSGLSATRMQDSTRIAIRNVEFRRLGGLTEEGGALATLYTSDQFQLLVVDTIFDGCNSHSLGGCVAVVEALDNSSFVFDNVEISNGNFMVRMVSWLLLMLLQPMYPSTKATYPSLGGCFYFESFYTPTSSPDLRIRNCRFFDCSSSHSGGGMYLKFVGYLEISNTSFTNMGHVLTPNDGGALAFLANGPSMVNISDISVRWSDATVGAAFSFYFIRLNVLLLMRHITVLDSGQVQFFAVFLTDLFEQFLPTLTGTGMLLQMMGPGSVINVTGLIVKNCSASAGGAAVHLENFGGATTVDISGFEFSDLKHTAVSARGLDGEAQLRFHGGSIANLGAAFSLRTSQANTSLLISDVSFRNASVAVSLINWMSSTSLQGNQFDHFSRAISGFVCGTIQISGHFRNGMGILLIDTQEVILDSSTFDGCDSDIGGGSLLTQNVRSLKVSNCSFANGQAKQRCIGCGGGAVKLSNTVGSISNATFENLYSRNSAGAILVGQQSHVALSDILWTNCTAASSGGALYAVDANLTISHASATDCNAHSGAAIAASGSELSITDFAGLRLHAWEGSLIYGTFCFGAAISSISCTDCHSTALGGALHLQQVESLSIAGLVTRNTSSGDDGGSLYLVGITSCSLSDVDMWKSHSGSHGGCIRAFGTTCSVDAALLSGCSASGSGGGLYLTAHSVFDLSNVTTESCSAQSGSSFSILDRSSAAIRRGVFRNGVAVSDGGSVQVASDSSLALEDGHFEACRSEHGVGGCVSVGKGSTFLANGTVLDRCSAAMDGGGVHVVSAADVTLLDTTFSGCSSEHSGGALFVESLAQASASGCAFHSNSAIDKGGAIAVESDAMLTLSGPTSFTDNLAATGGAISFPGTRAPIGLSEATHSGNNASQGDFAASGAAALLVTPESFHVFSLQPFSVHVDALDAFGTPMSSTAGVRVLLASASPTSKVLDGSGYMETTGATLPEVKVQGVPGALGSIIVSIDELGLTTSIPFQLKNCTVGEVDRGTECATCPLGSYSLALSGTICTTCPTGAICVNGSSMLPSWGRWMLAGGDVGGVCTGDGDCRYLQCPVKDACRGVADLRVNTTSSVQISSSVHSLLVLDSVSPELRKSIVPGLEALVDSRSPMEAVALNCTSRGQCRLYLQASDPWPKFGAEVVDALVFVPPACAVGYTGNLCAECSDGYGGSFGRECSQCLPGVTSVMAVLLLLVLLAAGLLLFLGFDGSGDSTLVPLLKIMWNYCQFMAIWVHLSLKWPSFFSILIQLQSAFASADGSLLVSYRCLVSTSSKEILILISPLCLMGAAGAVCFFLRRKKRVPANNEWPWTNKFSVAAFLLVFLLFPALCFNSLVQFPCEELSTGMDYRSIDFQISCSGSEYSAALVVGVVGVLLFVVGAPLFTIALTLGKKEAPPVLRKLKTFLLSGYTEKYRYLDAVAFLRKACFVWLLVMERSLGYKVVSVLAMLLCLGWYAALLEFDLFSNADLGKLERLSALAAFLAVASGALFAEADRLANAARVALAVLLLLVNLGFFLAVGRIGAPLVKKAFFPPARRPNPFEKGGSQSGGENTLNPLAGLNNDSVGIAPKTDEKGEP